jgi:hypothetical protein
MIRSIEQNPWWQPAQRVGLLPVPVGSGGSGRFVQPVGSGKKTHMREEIDNENGKGGEEGHGEAEENSRGLKR